MHRVQAELLEDASELAEKLAAKRKEKGADGGSPLLWKYTDPDTGKEFFLTERLTPVKSPYSGKPVSQRPKRETIPNVTKDVKQLSTPGGPGGKVNTRKRADLEVQASLWNSSWSKVTAYVDGWHIRIQVKTSRSPTGLVDEASERVCRDMKAETKKDVEALMASVKPKRLEFEKYVFLSGGDGGAVDYTYGVDVYAKDDDHAKVITDALGLHGVTIK